MNNLYIDILPFIELLRKSNLDISTAESILAQQIIDLGCFNVSETKLRNSLKSALIRKQNDIEIFDMCFDIFFQTNNHKKWNNFQKNIENSNTIDSR